MGILVVATDIYFTKYQAKTLCTCKVDGSGETTIYTASAAPSGISADTVNGYLYWADGDNVYRVDIDGSNPTTLLNYSPFNGGLARYPGSYLFPGAERYLYRCNEDGTGGTALIDRSATQYQIGHLSVDEINAKVYWQERYAVSGQWLRNYRADLDGSNPEQLWTNNPGGVPNLGGISVDPSGGKVYFVNRIPSLLLRHDLNGDNAETILDLSGEGSNVPVGIAVDSEGGKVYFTASAGGAASIRRCDLDGSNPETILTLTGELYSVGLALSGSGSSSTLRRRDPSCYVKGPARTFLHKSPSCSQGA